MDRTEKIRYIEKCLYEYKTNEKIIEEDERYLKDIDLGSVKYLETVSKTNSIYSVVEQMVLDRDRISKRLEQLINRKNRIDSGLLVLESKERQVLEEKYINKSSMTDVLLKVNISSSEYSRIRKKALDKITWFIFGVAEEAELLKMAK